MLRKMITHAYDTVPFYREHWKARPKAGSESDMRSLPLLTKSQVSRCREQLISTAFDQKTLVESRTGGSTGVALRLSFDRRCQDRRNAAALRSNRWAGWEPAAAAGALWGNPPVAKSIRERLRSVISERMVYLDTMALTEARVRQFMSELARRKIGVLFGHAHSLYVAATICRRHDIEAPPMRAIVSTSMMLLDNERRYVENVFGCKVSDRYGCEEVGLIASECEAHEGLHVNDDHLVVEIVREDGTPVGNGEVGLVVVTDLLNLGMPLIRYVVGDMSEWLEGRCSCGRQIPRLKKVVGRTADFLKGSEGQLVAGVSLVERTLTAIDGIEQMQIVQHDRQNVTVRCVFAMGVSLADVSGRIVVAMRQALGAGVQVNVQVVSSLVQEANGKYRFSICEC
jgi:phenylacetate-CoA ligase